MLSFLLAHWVAACLIGIGCNVAMVIVMMATDKDPNGGGAMVGMTILPFCLVPYLVTLGLLACAVIAIWQNLADRFYK